MSDKPLFKDVYDTYDNFKLKCLTTTTEAIITVEIYTYLYDTLGNKFLTSTDAITSANVKFKLGLLITNYKRKLDFYNVEVEKKTESINKITNKNYVNIGTVKDAQQNVDYDYKADDDSYELTNSLTKPQLEYIENTQKYLDNLTHPMEWLICKLIDILISNNQDNQTFTNDYYANLIAQLVKDVEQFRKDVSDIDNATNANTIKANQNATQIIDLKRLISINVTAINDNDEKNELRYNSLASDINTINNVTLPKYKNNIEGLADNFNFTDDTDNYKTWDHWETFSKGMQLRITTSTNDVYILTCVKAWNTDPIFLGVPNNVSGGSVNNSITLPVFDTTVSMDYITLWDYQGLGKKTQTITKFEVRLEEIVINF